VVPDAIRPVEEVLFAATQACLELLYTAAVVFHGEVTTEKAVSQLYQRPCPRVFQIQLGCDQGS